MLCCIMMQYGALRYTYVPLAASKSTKTKHGYLSAISERRKAQCNFALHMKILVSVSSYSYTNSTQSWSAHEHKISYRLASSKCTSNMDWCWLRHRPLYFFRGSGIGLFPKKFLDSKNCWKSSCKEAIGKSAFWSTIQVLFYFMSERNSCITSCPKKKKITRDRTWRRERNSMP